MKLFIHIPKNAGISIKDVLYTKYQYPFDGHFTCQQMKAKALLNNYLYEDIFTTCRNPYSRMVSVYLFLKIKMRTYTHYKHTMDLTIPFTYYSFSHFIKTFLCLNNCNFDYMNTYMFLPQHTWLDTADDVKIFKIENFSKIENYLNTKLPHCNKIEYKQTWKDYYDEDTKKIILAHYEQDFDKFKYPSSF
jgi:hypothetical protein